MTGPAHDHDRETWLAARKAAEAARRDDGGGCPDPALLAAWSDDRLEPGPRETVEHHLADCPACLDAVIDARRARREAADGLVWVPPAVTERARGLVRSGPPRRRALAWAAAAAAAILVSLAGFAAGSAAGPQRSVERPVVALAERAWSEDLLGVDPLDEPLLHATLLVGDLAREPRP